MEYLRRTEYEQYGEDLEPGEQVNVDHDDCSAGYDTKKRLYIKRTEDGNRIIAYCHHCGLSGSYGNVVYRTKRTKAQADVHRTGSGSTSYRLPSDYTRVTREWSSRGRTWVTRYGINEQEISRYSIGYSDYHRRIILPVYRDGKLKGYQSRRIEEHDDKPKYITRANEKPLFWTCDFTTITKWLVITEDILSAIKCARFHNSLALLTATSTDKIIEWIVNQGYNHFVIFLDNDNRQVKQAQIALKNRLSMLGKVKVIHADRDPKEHSNEELKRILP